MEAILRGALHYQKCLEFGKNYSCENPSSFWSQRITPTISIFSWKISRNWLPVEDKMKERGITLASKCHCCKSIETVERILLFDHIAIEVWSRFSSLFEVPQSSSHNVFTRYKAWKFSSDHVCEGHIRTLVPMLIFRKL